jgi:hypothetical protein
LQTELISLCGRNGSFWSYQLFYVALTIILTWLSLCLNSTFETISFGCFFSSAFSLFGKQLLLVNNWSLLCLPSSLLLHIVKVIVKLEMTVALFCWRRSFAFLGVIFVSMILVPYVWQIRISVVLNRVRKFIEHRACCDFLITTLCFFGNTHVKGRDNSLVNLNKLVFLSYLLPLMLVAYDTLVPRSYTSFFFLQSILEYLCSNLR